MSQLNKNNFIIWFGTLTDTPYSITAQNLNVNAESVSKSVNIDPFSGASSTYPINNNTLDITLHDNPNKPPIYDSVLKQIIYYLPADVQNGQIRTLKYRIYDIAGHPSAEKTITVHIISPATAWRGYVSSLQCRKDGNNRTTGMAYYSMLEKYYANTGETVNPLQLKINASGDPDFIADIADAVKCPLDPFFKKLTIYNQRNTGVIIEKINFIRPSTNIEYTVHVTQNTSKDVDMPADCTSFQVTLINPHAGENVIWSNANNLGQYGQSTNASQTVYNYTDNITPPPGTKAGEIYII